MDIDRIWSDFDALRFKPEEPPKYSNVEEYLCRFCGHPKLFDGVEMDLPTCTSCGAQDAQFVSNEPEWRSGADDAGDDPSRVGGPINTDLFSEGWEMNTKVSGKSKLQKIHMHQSMNHKDRALFHAYAEMDRVGKGILNLPDTVMHSAKMKYRAFNESVLTRGAVRVGIKANCVVQACREFNVPRTTKQIADAFGIQSRDVSRTFDMYQETNPETEVHVTKPADLVPQLMNHVSGMQEFEKRKLRMMIIRECQSLEECVELMGRTPKAVCCAVIYIVMSDMKLSPNRKEICRICEVSEPTLGKIETIIRKLKT